MTKSLSKSIAYDTALEGRSPSYDDKTISLRKFPYPYKAAVAICSDIDETKTTEEFLEIQRFLNTKDVTSMGEGVGLEISNSFYFYDKANQFSYFTDGEKARSVIIDLIRAGYIDCLHSYGDGATNRKEILRALDVLHKEDCKVDVWVNHYGARNNFCRKFEYMFGECAGDDPSSNVYHADVTVDYGIRFVWVGATTRAVGQSLCDTWPPVSNVFDAQYPLRSSVSVLKEMRKSALGGCRDERYIIHRQNRLLRPIELGDGQKVYEFMRYCNHPVSVGQGATSRGLSYVISKRAVEQLMAAEGFMVVYTHLGKNSDCDQVIAHETQAVLRNLERRHRGGDVYVTTTSKLLNYCLVNQYLVWWTEQSDGCTKIHMDHVDDPLWGKISPRVEELQGITFYVPDSEKVKVYLKGVEVNDIWRNAADRFGMESVMVPLTYLNFPY